MTDQIKEYIGGKISNTRGQEQSDFLAQLFKEYTWEQITEAVEYYENQNTTGKEGIK